MASAPSAFDPVRLVSCDLDGTLLGWPEASARFGAAWNLIPRGIRPLLVYNTGRTVRDTCGLVTAGRLPEPDYILAQLGTDLHSSLYEVADAFRGRFDTSWDIRRIEEVVDCFPGTARQPVEFLNRFKSSWYWDRASAAQLDELQARLRAAGMTAQVDYSCRRFLDVVPPWAGKGNALAWLCRRHGVALEHVLVAGDTANDLSMFALAGVRGIVVRNALPELRLSVDAARTFAAQAEMADGVVEGLRHFGVLPFAAAQPAAVSPAGG